MKKHPLLPSLKSGGLLRRGSSDDRFDGTGLFRKRYVGRGFGERPFGQLSVGLIFEFYFTEFFVCLFYFLFQVLFIGGKLGS